MTGYEILATISMIAFFVTLGLLLYFRVRVLQQYRVLLSNEVEFDKSHMNDREKLETEVLSRYPEHRKSILMFINYIKYAFRCSQLLIFIVTIFAATVIFGGFK